MKSKLLVFSSLVLLTLPAAILAQQPAPGTLTIDELVARIDLIARWIFTILLVLAVVFVLWAAALFITAGGNPAKVEEARSRLIFAAIGIVVAVLAWSVPTIVRSIIGL